MANKCTEINRCNQRGGRMLSIVDLLEAESLPEEIAVYLMAAVNQKEASFMVGANPGGAGKTTVMGALLNLVPSSYQLLPADSLKTLEEGRENHDETPKCWICHEISRGPYYAYLWGREARAFFEMADYGHLLATNLHADTYEQAYEQICQDNGVPERHFSRMHLQLYLKLESQGLGRVARKINTVYESTGDSEHKLIYDGDGLYFPHPAEVSQLVSESEFKQAYKQLHEMRQRGLKDIKDIHDFFL